VTWLGRDIERLAGKDRGVGQRDLRIQLAQTLRSGIPCGSRHHRRLRELIDFVNSDYVFGWSEAIDSSQPPSPERCSRAIASHMLDCGYSMRFLRRWTASLINSNRSLLGSSDFRSGTGKGRRPSVRSHGSVAEVLARAGYPDQVEDIARSMTVSPTSLEMIARQLAASGHHHSAVRVLARAWMFGMWGPPLQVLVTVDLRAAHRVIEEISRNLDA